MAKTAIQIITSALAKQYNLSLADATAFVDTIFAIVSSELKSGKQVKIKGLGTFKVQSVKPRESVNVNTGERVLIEGHDKISFTPDAAMKELVNKPFSQFETVVINDGVSTEELERIPTDESTDENKTEPDESFVAENAVVVQKPSAELVEITKKEVIEPVSEKIEATSEVVEKPAMKAVDSSVAEAETENDAEQAESPLVENEAKTVVIKEEALEQPITPSSLQNETKKEVQEVVVEEKDNVIPNVSSQSIQAVEADVEQEVGQAKNDSPKIDAPSNLSEAVNNPGNEDGDIESSENGMLKMVALIAVVVIVFLGIFLWMRFGGTKSPKELPVATQQAGSSEDKPEFGSRTVSADTAKVLSKPTKSQEVRKEEDADTYAAMNTDARIRYGAYNIIGVDRVVVLKKGETMEKYSRKTLGADMVGYFQVLNGRKTMQAGDTMKVPKVELRPEYRK